MKKGTLSKIKPNYPVNRRNIRKNKTSLNFINIIIIIGLFILSSSKSLNFFYIVSNKNNQITLEINRKGLQNIISSSYINKIDSIYINSEYQEKKFKI